MKKDYRLKNGEKYDRLVEYYKDENYSGYDRKIQNRSNYLYASDYGDSKNLFMESRIIDLEESLRILAKTVENLKDILREVFNNNE